MKRLLLSLLLLVPALAYAQDVTQSYFVVTNASKTSIGYRAGVNLGTGLGNVYLGYLSGPAVATNESDKLYISNTAGTPLIGGDFATSVVTFRGHTLIPSGSTYINGDHIDSDVYAKTNTPGIYIEMPTVAQYAGAFQYGANVATGPILAGFKSRATDGTANVAVNENDFLFKFRGYGADGADYEESAAVIIYADGEFATAGDTTDSPGRVTIATTPDGSATAVDIWHFKNTGSILQDGTNGGDIIHAKNAGFSILGNDDEGILHLISGSGASAANGAFIDLQADDYGGADAGVGIIANFGNNPTAKFSLVANATEIFSGDANGYVNFPFGVISRGYGVDSSLLDITGGGTHNNAAAGAFIRLYGDDQGGADAGGQLILSSGNNTTSNVTIGNGTADGADHAYTSIFAGGTNDASRGAGILLYGNEDFAPGIAQIASGNANGAYTMIMANGVGASNGIYLNVGGANNLIVQAALTTIATALDITATDAGFRVAAGADTACTTTCGANKGCLFGQNSDAAGAIVSCTDNNADVCLCATS